MIKKLRKLFFIREYTNGMWAVHSMQYSVVFKKIWIFRIAYLRNRGCDVILKRSKEEALALLKLEKKSYLEALKYVSR